MPDDARPSQWLPVNAQADASADGEEYAAEPAATPGDQTPAMPAASALPSRTASTTAPAVYDPSASLTSPPPPHQDTLTPSRPSVLSQYFPPRGGDDASRAAAASVPVPIEAEEFSAYGSVTEPAEPMLAWNAPPPSTANPDAMPRSESTPSSMPSPLRATNAGRVPRPVEVEDPEVIRPIAPPSSAEILPTTGSIPVLLPPSEDEPVRTQSTFTPDTADLAVQMLGASAVASASLAAAGAPTPASGIPRVDFPTDVPSFGASAPFVPQFEPVGPPATAQPRVSFLQKSPPSQDESAPAEPVSAAPLAAAAVVVGTAASFTPARMREGRAEDEAMESDHGLTSGWRPVGQDSGEIAQAPVAGTQTPSPGTDVGPVTVPVTVPAPIPNAVVPPEADVAEPATRKRRWWLWALIGAVVLAGIGTAVYRLFFLPEPIILDAPVVTEAPPTPSFEAVAVTDPSPFLASLPTEIGTYALTSYEVLEVIGDEEIPARAAEHVVLTYGQSEGATTLTVDAYQFYNVDEAQIAYDVWAEGATDVTDVVSDGQVVGQRAKFESAGETTVVWRNETSVFVLVGPAEDVEYLYTYYGL